MTLTLLQDIIITMLPKGQHVRNVFMEPTTGLLSALRDGQPRRPKLFLECSTIDVKTSLEIGEAVSKHSTADYLDAPVSGGVHGANNGTLTFMVGGPRQVFDDATTVLAYMGKAENIFHCGAAGAGLATKQINNYMSATNMIAVCEGMNMGRLYGLDPKVLAKVVNASTGMSRNSREQNPVKGISDSASAATNFEGGFSTELCHGVIEMSVGLAQQLKAKTVLSSIVDEFYRSAVMHPKCKCKDFRSIYRLFEEDEDMIDSTST